MALASCVDMKYILLIIISGQLNVVTPGLSYEQCRRERVGGDVIHVLNRLKADGHLSKDVKIVALCRAEE